MEPDNRRITPERNNKSGAESAEIRDPNAETRDPKEIRMLSPLRISDFLLRRLRLRRRGLPDLGFEASSHETLALVGQRQKNLPWNPGLDRLAENHFQSVTAGEILFASLVLLIFPSQHDLWEWGRAVRPDLDGFAAQFLALAGEQNHGDTQVRR